MASSEFLSESVKKKGQTPLMCQLCENEPKIKWKCLECGLMMCMRCRDKVHTKFPLAEDHTIIDIKEISKHQADTENKLDLKKIKCNDHTGKYCCMYCKTCQELVCLTCMVETHKKHNLSEMDQEYQTKLEMVKSGEGELKGKLQSLKTREKKLKQIKSSEQSKYDKVKKKILDYEQALVNEIKEYTNKLMRELDQKWEVVSKNIKDEENHLKVKQSQIQKQSQKINQLLQSDNAKDVFSYSSLKPLVLTSFNGIPKFTPGDQTKIPLILGKLEDVAIQYNTQLKIDKKFDTDMRTITTVVSCPDDSLWVSNLRSGILQKVKPNDDNLKVMSALKIEVFDAALLSSGDLLLSVIGSSNLKLIPSGSTDIQDSVYTVSPLLPTAVHVTCDNKVIVGVRDGESSISDTGPRQIIVMDQTGRHEKVIEYERHGFDNPLFTFPHCLTSNSQGNIAVIDFVYQDRGGKVKVLDEEGDIRNIYAGHPYVNNEDNPFKPSGITTTPLDNFVVADFANHTLHILNSKGKIITFYNTRREMGILFPLSLSVSTTGHLYIGCDTYKDSDKNSPLFIVDNYLF